MSLRLTGMAPAAVQQLAYRDGEPVPTLSKLLGASTAPLLRRTRSACRSGGGKARSQ